MTLHILERRQWVGGSVETVFSFFADAGNLEQITPPWLHFHIISPLPNSIAEGSHIEYRLRWRGVPIRWLTQIKAWQPNNSFIDVQIRGAYKLWRHTHTFEPDKGGTLMIDRVEYELPYGPIGALAHAIIVRRDLDAIFDYRAETIEKILNSM